MDRMLQAAILKPMKVVVEDQLINGETKCGRIATN